MAVAQLNGMIRGEQLFGLPVTDHPWATFLDVTPDIARAALAVMPTQQRPLSERVVKHYAEMIKKGDYLLTHQGVAFDEHGFLSDGQHRFHAIVLTGKTVRLLVSFNVPHDSFTAFDRGYMRNPAQDLVIMGLADNRAQGDSISATAKIVRLIDLGLDPTVKDTGRGVSTDILVETLKSHPLLRPTVAWADVNRGNRSIPRAPFAALLALMREVDDKRATKMATKIVTRIGIERATDPVAVLCQAQDATSGRKAPDRAAFMYRFVRCWNAICEGRSVSRLYPGPIKEGGFPDIAGYRRKQG
jgi:hypothetical protein